MQILNIDKKHITIDSSEQMQLTLRHDAQTPDAEIVVNVKENHSVQLYIIADSKARITERLEYNLARNSRLQVNTLDIDNKIVERNQTFNLNGENIDVKVYGLYITGQSEDCVNNIKMNHNFAHCTSEQLYKGIVANKATFKGLIYIAKDAQRSQAYQQNHNILMNDTAKVNTQPFLEIYADDVKCSHGATVGKNDPAALYYMRQRGISLEDAKKIMLEAFLNQTILIEQGKEQLLEQIADKLSTI